MGFKTVGSMTLWFGLHTSGAWLAIVLNEGSEEQPSIVVSDELKGFVLAKVSGSQMVMFVEEYAESEIIVVGDEDLVFVSEETFGVGGPVGVGQIYEVVGDWVRWLGGFDVRVKLLNVHDGDGSEDGKVEGGCSEGWCQLFIGKDWMEIVRIYSGIVTAPLLRIDIPSSS